MGSKRHLLSFVIYLAAFTILVFFLSGDFSPTSANKLIRTDNISNSTIANKDQDPCRKYGHFTVFTGGRLGNEMTQYATVYAHSRRLGAEFVISKIMRENLTNHFPHISAPTVNGVCKLKWTKVGIMEARTLNAGDLRKKNYMIDEYVMDLEYFYLYQHDLVTKEFLFNEDIIRDSQAYLRNVKESLNLTQETVFVSVHVRRTDYQKWMKQKTGGDIASGKFYELAMNTFRNRFNTNSNKVHFVVASDDVKWCKETFKNLTDVTYVTDSKEISSQIQPTFDLSVLTQCNHSIISFGTFGFWSAFLKESGEVILASGTSAKPSFLETLVAKTLPRWQILKDPCFTDTQKGKLEKIC